MTGAEGVAPPSIGGARDYAGPVRWAYRPKRDGRPDPGEIVWTWVAFEEDPTAGKDRPVVVIGLADRRMLAVLMLSSRDRSGDPRWLPIGAGAWDEEHRPSWVRSDRVLAVESRAIRREGAILPRPVYEIIRVSVGSHDRAMMRRAGATQRLGVLQRLGRALRGRGQRSVTP